MCICVSVFMCLCVNVCCVHLCVSVHLCTYMYVSVSMCLCIRACMLICVFVPMCVSPCTWALTYSNRQDSCFKPAQYSWSVCSSCATSLYWYGQTLYCTGRLLLPVLPHLPRHSSYFSISSCRCIYWSIHHWLATHWDSANWALNAH